MRSMHDLHLFKKKYCDARTLALRDFSAEFNEQCCDIAPFHARRSWPGKDQL